MVEIKEAIASCINYIENNINNKISLDDISTHTGMSKYYLHRMFKSLTGESIIEYVQSRKLTSSINDLINSNKRIIDIALDYGFDYEQSYIRAFRKKFRFTPLKVRNCQISLGITEKINSNDILSVGNSITYKPGFVFRQKFFLIGSKHKLLSKSGDKTASAFGRDFFYNQKQEIENAINPQIYYGYTDWSKNESGFTYYIPSVEVPNLDNIPEGMTGISVPAHKYVVFKFVGFFRPDEISGRHVGRLLVQLYSKWIFSSGYKFADKFRFEYIDISLSKDNYCELYVYQPIIEIK
jgi:AraC family transcriptional regulator